MSLTRFVVCKERPVTHGESLLVSTVNREWCNWHVSREFHVLTVVSMKNTSVLSPTRVISKYHLQVSMPPPQTEPLSMY